MRISATRSVSATTRWQAPIVLLRAKDLHPSHATVNLKHHPPGATLAVRGMKAIPPRTPAFSIFAPVRFIFSAHRELTAQCVTERGTSAADGRPPAGVLVLAGVSG